MQKLGLSRKMHGLNDKSMWSMGNPVFIDMKTFKIKNTEATIVTENAWFE